MSLPETISFVHPGTAASIPANWERTTAFDGNHLYWTAGDDANTTGGAANHTHTFTSATHAFSGGAASAAENTDTPQVKPTPASVTHTHASANSGTGSVTSGATTNEPPWISLIFINPADSAQTGVPDDCWALSDASVPTGWTEPSDADNKFVKGAAVNSDLTGGGSTAHLHSLDHTMPNTNSNNNTGTGALGDASDSNWYDAGVHYHVVSFASADVDSQSDANSSLPLYEKLLWIKNETGGADIQTGVIGFYLGLVAAIPANWSRVDPATGDFIMGAANSGEIGDAGGEAQHDHTGTAHTHVGTGGTASSQNGSSSATGPFSGSSAGATHTWTVNNATDTVSANSSKSHYPEWIKTILLKYTAPATISLRMLAATGVGV